MIRQKIGLFAISALSITAVILSFVHFSTESEVIKLQSANGQVESAKKVNKKYVGKKKVPQPKTQKKGQDDKTQKSGNENAGVTVSPDNTFHYGVFTGPVGIYGIKFEVERAGFKNVDDYLNRICDLMKRAKMDVAFMNAYGPDIEDSAEGLDAWIKMARKCGILLMPEGGALSGGSDELWKAIDWKRELPAMKQFYTTFLKKYNTEPTIWAWILNEEPPIHMPIFEGIRELTNHILATVKPVQHVGVLYHWTETVEIAARVVRPKIMPSNIGVFGDTPGITTWAQNTLYYFTELQARFKAADSVGARFQVMGSANSYERWQSGRLIQRGRGQSLAEMRVQAFGCIFIGCKDFMWFLLRDIDPEPPRRDGQFDGELSRGMTDFWLKPRSMFDYAVQVGKDLEPLKKIIPQLRPDPLLEVFSTDNFFDCDDGCLRQWENDFRKVNWRVFTNTQTRAKYYLAVNFDTEASHKALPHSSFPNNLHLRKVNENTVINRTDLARMNIEPGNGILFEEVR